MPYRVFRRKPWAVAAVAASVVLMQSAGAGAAERASDPSGAGPAVVASIPPVHSLTAMVMAGVGRSHLLLAKSASPHDYALKPSDARALSRARLVVWVGPALEAFLAKPLKTLAPGAEKLALLSVPGLRLRPIRKGGVWETAKGHGHDDGHGHDQNHDRGHGEDDRAAAADPHIWLDPGNGVAMIEAIAEALARADPKNKARYAENAARAGARLAVLDRALDRRLAAIRRVPYIVFHDAYGYFEARYGLNAVGAVAVSAAHRPGVRRIRDIRARIRKTGAVCVFAEPQFAPAVIRTVTEGSGARTGTLDPLGVDLSSGPGLYPALLINLADALVRCLGPSKAR